MFTSVIQRRPARSLIQLFLPRHLYADAPISKGCIPIPENASTTTLRDRPILAVTVHSAPHGPHGPADML